MKIQVAFLAMLACFLALSTGAAAATEVDAKNAELIATGRKLFTSVTPSCAICHTLKDAGSQGEVGPTLDEIKPDAQRVAKAIKNGLGNMPAYGERLSAADIDALSRYVAFATGADK